MYSSASDRMAVQSSVSATMAAPPAWRRGCSRVWRLAMSRVARNCFLLLNFLALRSMPVSRSTPMGVCRAARRKGSREDKNTHRADSAATGTSSQPFRENTISPFAKREMMNTVTIPSRMPRGREIRHSSHASRPNSRRICRRVAPTARSMPISSVFWASMLSMALEMATPQLSSNAMPSRIQISAWAAYAFRSSTVGSSHVAWPVARLMAMKVWPQSSKAVEWANRA